MARSRSGCGPKLIVTPTIVRSSMIRWLLCNKSSHPLSITVINNALPLRANATPAPAARWPCAGPDFGTFQPRKTRLKPVGSGICPVPNRQVPVWPGTFRCRFRCRVGTNRCPSLACFIQGLRHYPPCPPINAPPPYPQQTQLPKLRAKERTRCRTMHNAMHTQ